MKTIIFRLDFKREYGGFVSISNFISKMQEGITLTAEEVRGASSYLYDNVTLDTKNMVDICATGREHFRTITKPENLVSGTAQFQVAYCICIEASELDDVVDMQYFILIKKFYKDVLIGAFVEGDRNFYHKLSHYLYEINQVDAGLYNCMIYEFEKQRKRLQLMKVNRLGAFVPLLYIDGDTQETLKKSLEEVIDQETLRSCMQQRVELNDTKYTPYMKGCLAYLQKILDVTDETVLDLLPDCLVRGNLLSFVLFAYLYYDCLSERKKGEERIKAERLVHFYHQMESYAAGCLQLVENIVLHAASGTGVLSIRLHKNRTEYLKRRYGIDNRSVPYLEILITDYCGTHDNKNIAQNFLEHMETLELRTSFSELYPVDFIETGKADGRHQQNVKMAFQKYYLDSDHIGKHYGLKIFQYILRENKGILSFYSHSSSVCGEGESWNILENQSNNTYAQCMPGTSFSILFPLEVRNEQQQGKRMDIDDNYILPSKMGTYIHDYSCIDREIKISGEIWQNREEKEAEIQRLAQQLLQKQNDLEGKRCIVYISGSGIPANYAECICKALLIDACRFALPDYVFYDCQESFMLLFLQTLSVYFEMGSMGYVLQANDFTVALYALNPFKKLVLIPQSVAKTKIANRLPDLSLENFFEKNGMVDQSAEPTEILEEEILNIPPYDIMHRITIGEEKKTIFEAYVQQVLETDIQDENFGCKISNTHMRLGSTIHIDVFYEAELLFHNKMFSSRFAYLLVEWIEQNMDFQKNTEFTLYGYALYSEFFLFKAVNILQESYPEKKFDYAILEREAERRGFHHVDRIRYSTFFRSEAERKQYFSDRKIICVVPVNSTLKTHEKLIDMFCKENGEDVRKQIILNFAIVLVGSKKKNAYWVIDEKTRTFSHVELEISPMPCYFVLVKVDYQEAPECRMCFPENPLLERPLIEVNASSTIPNQAFGLFVEPENEEQIGWNWIKNEDEKMRVLKSSLIYSHINRGENHHSFYFQTDHLFTENKEDIITWMKDLSSDIIIQNQEQYILVCPSHFSNAGFLECINKFIFHDAAQIIRIDADKEYRCNMEAKYSYFAGYLEGLIQRKEAYTIRVYYVDDCIITGRTFQRCKSLIESVLGLYEKEYPELKIHIFERVYVLLDRNSEKTRRQYLHADYGKMKGIDRYFCAYRTLRISSIRNHGDSCIICQMVRQDKMLYRTSVSKLMSKHWSYEKKLNRVRTVEEARRELEEVDSSSQEKQDRAYRRMFCMHVVGCWLNDAHHGNRAQMALKIILEIMLADYNGRRMGNQKEAFEYLLSYLKVISRPFPAFAKPVREAVFDVILIFLEILLNDLHGFTEPVLKDKPYLGDNIELFQRVDDEIMRSITDEGQKKDLLLVLMKQSMELRSNYFIRPENIKKLSVFADQYSPQIQTEIYNGYLFQVKKLVGVNSDTSKSAWLDGQLCEMMQRDDDQMKLPEKICWLLYFENSRAYYDGLERLEQEGVSQISKYQYRDFRLAIRQYGWLDENETLNKWGNQALNAAIKFVRIGSKSIQKNADIREICREIVNLMGQIAESEVVDLVLELDMECNQWEDEVRSQYNDLVPDEMDELKLTLDNKKEYMVIASIQGDSETAESLFGERAEKIQKFRQNRDAVGYGFHMDISEQYLIWEIGEENSYPLIFYVDFKNLDKRQMLSVTKCILSMNYCCHNSIFNRKTRMNLYELMLAEKERLLYNVNKIESHASSDTRYKQYNDVRMLKGDKQDHYRSYVLTLLKDLQVSDTYRSSLHSSFYQRKLEVGSFSWTGTALSFDRDENVFRVAATNRYAYIDVHVHTNQTLVETDEKLEASDELIAFQVLGGERTPFLLIMALIMNAANEKRALVKCSKDDPEVGEVDVYLTRTENGDLRIMNFIKKMDKTLEQINQLLERPPRRDGGISLWSMSRYMKSVISTMISNCIQQGKACMQKQSSCESKMILHDMKTCIEELTGISYQVRAEELELQKKKCFCVCVPVLAGKYGNYKQYFKETL